MLQELFAGVGLVQETKMPLLTGPPRQLLIDGASSSCSPLSSATTTVMTTPSSSSATSVSSASTAAGGPNAAPGDNLRCPRCDSTNTKFCYYNNYSLTQPRHFCKTCRRYWTKGGVLRNIPIGGGCRKAKSIVSTGTGVNLMGGNIGSPGKPGGVTKISKPVATAAPSIITAVGRSVGLGGDNGAGMDHTDMHSASFLRASVQNSALLSLLRATQQVTPTTSHGFGFVNQNPNPRVLQNSARGEQPEMSNLLPDPGLMTKSLFALEYPSSHQQSTAGGNNVGICSSLWYHSQQQQQQPQPNHMLLFGGDHHQLSNTRPLELPQWITPSSGSHYYNDHSQVLLGNYNATASSFPTHTQFSAAAPAIASQTLSTATVPETNNVSAFGGGDFGQWKLPLFNFSDVSTKSRGNP